jgi:molybdenum cofactor guanylyltransferase
MKILTSENITAVILAGGKGRRFAGNDKGLIMFKQRPLITYLLEAIAPQVSQIIINANRNLDVYAHYGYPVISDAMSDYQGPLAGFSVAMSQVTTTHIVTLPCDAPFVSADYVHRLCDAFNQQQPELAVAHDGERLQPVHALLPVALKPSLDHYLQTGKRKIDHWYAQHHFSQVDFSDSLALFQNINTAEQLAELENRTGHNTI